MVDQVDSGGCFFTKQVGEKLDFTINWAPELGIDTISISSWTVPDGIIQASPSPSKTNTTSTIWVSGGSMGEEYDLVNEITTDAGRLYTRTLRLKIVPTVPISEIYTDTQLRALRAALASGALTVEYDGKRVQYRSLTDMERIITLMEIELNGTTGNRFSLASFQRS